MTGTSEIQIGDINGEKGKIVRGFVKIGETAMGPIQFPVAIITGRRPGPTFCLTAGVHATEYPAIDAVLRTIQSIDPKTLAGTVIAVPVVNQIMFQTRTPFVNPIDGKNLNRMAPGLPSGTISEVIAYHILKQVVSKADVHIDCHGGDMGEELLAYAGYSLSGNPEQDRRGEIVIRLYSPHIFALYKEGTDLPPTPGSISSAAATKGVVSVLAESGSDGTLRPEDVTTHLNGIQNVMRYLGMIPGSPVIKGERLRATGQFIVSALRGGLVRLKIEIGQNIEAGQEVAEIVDVFGDVVERVVTKESGIARLIWTHKVVNTGDPIVKCWRTEPAVPFEL